MSEKYVSSARYFRAKIMSPTRHRDVKKNKHTFTFLKLANMRSFYLTYKSYNHNLKITDKSSITNKSYAI